MRIHNVHERRMKGSMEAAGELLDSLSGPQDGLWPGDQWPPLKLDAPLSVGSAGGHGPVRYRVSEYVPGQRVAFSFMDAGLASGMKGGHAFDAARDGERVLLRHVLEAECGFGTWLRWAAIIRPLHDALLEDALDRAERAMNPSCAGSARWSPWVRVLRLVLKARNRSQEG